MEIETPLWQPIQELSTVESITIPHGNFNVRQIFKLFRRLELLSASMKIVASAFLRPVQEKMGQRFRVVIEPEFEGDLLKLSAARPRFESEVEIALASNLCPVSATFLLDYPEAWLDRVLPYLSQIASLQERIFKQDQTNPLDENSQILQAQSFFPFYSYSGGICYLDLDACTNEEIYEDVYNSFQLQLQEVLQEFWRDGIMALTEEEALRWQCQEIQKLPSSDKNFYQLQAHYMCGKSNSAFLIDRLSGLDYLLPCKNQAAQQAVSAILQTHQSQVIFYRGYVAVEIRDHNDYQLISQLRKEVKLNTFS